jgi:AraC-like DNA-binding protein
MKPVGKHMEVEAPLSEVIKHLYCIQTTADFEKMIQHLSPDLDMMLIFNFGKPVRVSFADNGFEGLEIKTVSVVGPLRKMFNYEVLPGTDVIAVVFHTYGFYRLFQWPMDALSGDELVDPDALLQVTGFHALWESLKKLETLDDRIILLKEYGQVFIQDADEASVPLLNGISYFENPSIQPVRAIAMDSALSERTIQLRFKKYLGYSPKELLRFLRFKKVINNILNQESSEVDWYGLIDEFGYHDQSHLIKDFHLYLGTTPQKFVREILGKEFCVSKEGKYYFSPSA